MYLRNAMITFYSTKTRTFAAIRYVLTLKIQLLQDFTLALLWSLQHFPSLLAKFEWLLRR